MLHNHHQHHPMQKQVQGAFNTLTEGMKIYGTLKGAFEVGKGLISGARAAYAVAAPMAAALL